MQRARITYLASDTVASFIAKVETASVMELVELERQGVSSGLLRDMAAEMDIPVARLRAILGVTKASMAREAAGPARVTGMASQAALNMARLLGMANGIVARSTAAEGFDASRWLGEWIELPQPALGGRRPADLMDTPSGAGAVARVLGAIESGAYQ